MRGGSRVVVLLHRRECRVAPGEQAVVRGGAAGGGQAEERGRIGGEREPTGGVLRSHQSRDRGCIGTPERDVDANAGGQGDEWVARVHGSACGRDRVDGVREVQMQHVGPEGDGRAAGHRRKYLAVTGRLQDGGRVEPQVDARGDGGGRDGGQSGGGGELSLTVAGGDGDGASGEQAGSETVRGCLPQPDAVIHGVGPDGQVQHSDAGGVRSGQHGHRGAPPGGAARLAGQAV